MEAINVLQDLITNLGFPIAMVFYFIWDKTKITNQLSEAVNNNTVVITQLLEVMRSKDVVLHE